MFDDMIKKINAQEIDFRTRNEERLKNEESLNDSINEILEYMFMNFLQNYFPSIMEKNMSKLLETKNMGKYLSERVLLTKEDLIELRFDEDDWNFNLNEKVSNIKFQDNKYISRDKFIKYVIERFSLYGINCKEDYIVDNPKLYFEDLERLDKDGLGNITELDSRRYPGHNAYFFEGKISQFEEMFTQEMQRINYTGISNYDVSHGNKYR